MTKEDARIEEAKMKATTDENLRKAIEIVSALPPHQDANVDWAIEQLIIAAHALGILKLRHARMREGIGTCSPDVKQGLSLHDKNKQEAP